MIIKPKGIVTRSIEYKDGSVKIEEFENNVLFKGREALAACLANELGDNFEFYISRMIFGDGGTDSNGVRKSVSSTRNGLFGTTRLSKPVFSTINPSVPSQVIFSSVITFDELNDVTINEMALQMKSGDLYSMTTFGDFTKTSFMQLSWSWRLTFV